MRWFIGIFLIAALAALGYGWPHIEPYLRLERTSAATAAAPVVNEIAVEAQRVKIGAIRRQIEAVGSLRSDESVMIRPEISGRVAEILFKEGAKISRGEPLVRLDASVAKAQVAQQAASVTLSRANQERAADLMAKGAGSPRTHDEALAKMRADEAALALAQATLEKSTLLAPFDGVLGLRRISVGDYVNPGQDIVNIENLEAMKVDFRIPEVFALQLKVSQTIRVSFDAIPGKTFEGSVYAIDPALDPNGRAVILRARMANIDSLLRSGMFARVVLLLDDTTQSVLVPESALVPVGQEHFVFQVVGGRASLTKIKIGQRRAGEVEVAEGLSRDAIVVSEGALKLRDGSLIRARTAD
ncbi:efflux RND transporter periplasmic adaptor subunit [Bradyrhizobium sp. LHD-71]|uniref:efflux RND transporter periplasmic adaptor subunit n=1 Tax=Bradyrhizobium sp. LHD-71 TaxID=3072141 RepID=UPI00280CD6EE|nr:efflux RND transporter periplasmic adaptor subunit [Bradyrhizobium sp. LHD-71]MDQ8729762.1 efflux RND transporter periplasmic adaptor subunit [Bradyrhizobium sp. LHD-71]